MFTRSIMEVSWKYHKIPILAFLSRKVGAKIEKCLLF